MWLEWNLAVIMKRLREEHVVASSAANFPLQRSKVGVGRNFRTLKMASDFSRFFATNGKCLKSLRWEKMWKENASKKQPVNRQ